MVVMILKIGRNWFIRMNFKIVFVAELSYTANNYATNNPNFW